MKKEEESRVTCGFLGWATGWLVEAFTEPGWGQGGRGPPEEEQLKESKCYVVCGLLSLSRLRDIQVEMARSS